MLFGAPRCSWPDPAALGERTIGRPLNMVGWITTGVMCLAAIGLIVTTIPG